MATTTNYGWTTPDDTALVKDGAAAIRTLGSSVDTTTKALNPSTTLGDIEYRSSTANTNTRLGIGTSGQVLTVSGGVPAWVSASSGSMTQLGTTTTLSGASTTVSFTATGYKNLYILIQNVAVSANANLRLDPNALNNVTTFIRATSYQAGETLDRTTSGRYASYVDVSSASTINSFVFTIYDVDSANYKTFSASNGYRGGAYAKNAEMLSGIIEDTNAISSIVLAPSTGNFSGGTVKVFGVN